MQPCRYSRGVAEHLSDPGAGSGASWKRWALGAAAVLFAVLVAQNFQEVEFDFLFVHTTAPLIVALLIAGALGGLIGWAAPRVRRGGRD
jgi:uncharacterized integral membrane protein